MLHNGPKMAFKRAYCVWHLWYCWIMLWVSKIFYVCQKSDWLVKLSSVSIRYDPWRYVRECHTAQLCGISVEVAQCEAWYLNNSVAEEWLGVCRATSALFLPHREKLIILSGVAECPSSSSCWTLSLYCYLTGVYFLELMVSRMLVWLLMEFSCCVIADYIT